MNLLFELPGGIEWIIIILFVVIWFFAFPVLFFVYRAKYKDLKERYGELLERMDQ